MRVAGAVVSALAQAGFGEAVAPLGTALTEAQLDYAASDVLHLHPLKAELERRLAREGRTALAQACFDFLPTRAHLDLMGWGDDNDIFHH